MNYMDKMISTEEVRKAINIILSDKCSYNTSLNYAVNYCRVALSMEGEELQVQCLYILNNITRWRHQNAKEVRKILKGFKSYTIIGA